MSKKKGLHVLLAILLIFALVSPAMANDELRLAINGEEKQGLELLLKEGMSFTNAADLAVAMGLEYEQVGETLFISQGEAVFEMALTGKDISTEAASIQLPIRLIGEGLGYAVGWDNGLISLTKEQAETETDEPGVEPTEELTAMDILAKSGQKSGEINNYAMEGSLTQEMKMQAGEDEFDMITNSEIISYFQNEPMQIYVKQIIDNSDLNIEMPEAEEVDLSMEMEIYMDEESMYIKMAGEDGWIVQPHFLPIEFLKEQQKATEDPLKAVEEMLKMGMNPEFLPEITVDGREFYVIRTEMDMSQVIEEQQELMHQIIGGFSSEIEGVSAEDMDLVIGLIEKLTQEMLKNSDYLYTVEIDKETLLPEKLYLQIVIDLEIELNAFLEQFRGQLDEELIEELLADIPEGLNSLSMKMVQDGEFRLFDYGGEFIELDLSQIIDLESLQ